MTRPPFEHATRGPLRALASTTCVAIALVGLAACSAAAGVTAPPPTWPVPPEQLPPATSGAAEPNLTCGGGRTFPASGLDAATGAETAPGPEFDALRAGLAKFGSEFPGSASLTWRLAGHDATGAIFLARSEAPGAPAWVAIDVVADAGGWQPSGMGQCNPSVVLSPEFGSATWALDPAFASPTPDATELHVLVREAACSGGSPATGRMSPPVIEWAANTLTITIGVRRLDGIQTCPGPPKDARHRDARRAARQATLLDGGRVPAAPPSPAF